MATLVTGGTGFVASNPVKGLARAGHQVVVYDLNGPDQLVSDFLGELSSRVTFVEGDILNPETLEQLGANHSIDKIVHAAVFTATRLDIEKQRSRDIVEINVAGTANLLELARSLSVKRFVYVSSGSVYGARRAADQVINEDDAPTPDTLYGMTKYASELITRRYVEIHGLSTASARLSTPYGPMERVTGHRAVMSIPYRWTRSVVRGEPIPTPDLTLGRDYTYVTDTASGIRAVLDATSLGHDVYNITAGNFVSLATLLASVRNLSPDTSTVEAGPEDTVAISLGPARGPLSGYRLGHDLGWSPEFDLTSGLADYIQWRRDAPFLD